MNKLYFYLKEKNYIINLRFKYYFGIFLFDLILYKWKKFKILNIDLKFFKFFHNLNLLIISERLKQSGLNKMKIK